MSEFDDNLPEEVPDFETTEDEDDESPIKRELLTIRLFKEAVKKTQGNTGDRILEKFADYVLPNLIQQLAGATAKGGKFFEITVPIINAKRALEGKKPLRRDNAGDQSIVAHLLNGLFPSYRILKKLQAEDINTNPVRRNCEEIQTSVFIVSYILHDYEKFPDYTDWLEKNLIKRNWEEEPPKKLDAPNLGRGYISKKILDFGLQHLLGEAWEELIDDIIEISSNAGVKNDADLGLVTRGLKPLDDERLDSRIRQVLIDLVSLSDLFASVVKHPRDVEDGRLPTLLNKLSNHQLKLTYHSLSENRGILTNIFNNTLIAAHPQDFYTPLLYLPDGVVYLATVDAPPITIDTIPEQVIAKIKNLCAEKLKERQTGFNRDGKGFKFADYYWLFFDVVELMEVSIDAASRLLPDSKTASAEKRGESLQSYQAQGELPEYLNLQFPNEVRIDRLAEFGDILCRGIWGSWCEKINDWQKQFPKNQRKNIPDLDLTQKLAEYLELSAEIPAIRQIQSLKKTGGVPLDWYYLSAQYFRIHSGLSFAEILEVMKGMVNHAATLIRPILAEFQDMPDGWDDLKTYVNRIISLPTGAVIKPEPDSFLVELKRYNAAKITGRGRENVCAISSSAYTVTEQMESATLFAPQVYSNRQILFNAQAAKRQICSIWSIEIMLRQILMNQTNAVGADFESRKYRYLYLYPTYFFTPETNKFLQLAYNQFARTRFDAEMRKHFITENQVANFEIEDYLKVDSLLIKENLKPEDDRTFKISFPEHETLTFFFLGLPPGREHTDTESWVTPAWLALTLPLVLDVKVVASESPVPPFISGADFEETVLLDGEHQAIRSLIKKDNYRLDSILPRTSEKREFSPLNALTAAYSIHLEANRKKDGDPDWGKLADLARDLETSPLYVFHYLNKWLRKQDKIDSVSIAKIRLYQYLYYCFDHKGDNMTKLEELTKLYRRFYRAKSKGKSPKTNAILKPIDEAADVILKFEKAIASDNKSLTEVVAARLAKLMNNVRRKEAEGQGAYDLVKGEMRYLTSEEERQAVYKFAEYFVEVIFYECFKGDRARLSGTQLNLIKDTCEYLYRVADDEYWKNRKQNYPEDITDVDTDAEDAA
ncbi:type I-D CRISPR-associated protein Cas10d/Csc3 [Nostoc sp. FACHB-152]|uniref:type I-D CRISPR-associated protein Cas10d/Csc3 n=1 Tax=unclassified Nostoc TaxID=2593658 RepID=UPI0016834F09|nr:MULTISPECIES: type I-D CRISPR-associated protein Cas10d/Csc3 [unclassified Nostoc]MBD2449865.1 type I-D CRISPR-associated protein Cas10d/Csc3 [Nostoc sp. FACHB-152]MBD2471841.1 type I-D CRISPR-associated protein Cas10d/Csc3 [Nostoc sp. FACHB-145]